MRRVIEKLTQERKEKEQDLAQRLTEIEGKTKEFHASSLRLDELYAKLKESLQQRKEFPRKLKRGVRTSFLRKKKQESDHQDFNRQILALFEEYHKIHTQNLAQTQALFSSLAELIRLNADLANARDREWDALGNNHVGMIFKSMEWRVDKLASAYEDANMLMKKFILLKEQLSRLLTVLEEKRLPSSIQVEEIFEPLEDWRYAGFENRFRGYEEETKKQQQVFIPFFKKGGKVLDLGCGRGEFLDLLKQNGIEAIGIDLNGQMIDTCRDKGHHCLKGDILEKLARWEDNSLDGIFSSQVIEHTAPSYLKKLVETAYTKLTSSGVLILETINPTSVFALVQIYFLDLSHKTPVHPQVLKFLLETAGFEKVELQYSEPLGKERLENLPGADELSSILNKNIDTLNELLFAPPNYAVIGIKK